MAYVRNYSDQYNMMHYDEDKVKQAIYLIEEAVQGEKEDEMFYDYLISVSKTKEEKEIIKSIRDDEKKHNAIFKKMYEDITGKDISSKEDEEEFEKPESYTDGIRKALFGELGAVKKYKKIAQLLPNPVYKEIVYGIILDEITHAIKYNYILQSNYKCKRYKKCRKINVSEKMSRVNETINQKSEDVFNKAKNKIQKENILEEVIMPGIVLGIKNTYMSDDKDKEKTRTNVDFKQDILVKYIASSVELLYDKFTEKVDLDKMFEKYGGEE